MSAEALRIGSLCSGYGGLDLAVEAMFGAETVWHAEVEPAACRILEAHWPAMPNLGDIKTAAWDLDADILTAGYPCQPFSSAGRRDGTDDSRHLWPYVAEAVRRVRPRYVVLENVAGHRSLGFGRVLADLAAMRYVGSWVSLRASDIGACHGRERVFILATDTDHPAADREWARPQPRPGSAAPDANRRGRNGRARQPQWSAEGRTATQWGRYEPAIRRWERTLGRVAPAPTQRGSRGGHSLSPWFVEWMQGLDEGHVCGVEGLTRNEQLKALGNGVVPQQAAEALHRLISTVDRARAA